MKKLMITIASLIILAPGCKAQSGGIGFWTGADSCLTNGIDLLVVIDATGSMGGALNNIKTQVASLIDVVVGASSNNYRLGLIATYDYPSDPQEYIIVERLRPNNKETFISGLNSVTLGYGGDDPEPWANSSLIGISMSGHDGGTSLMLSNAYRMVLVVTDAPDKKAPGPFPDFPNSLEVLQNTVSNPEYGMSFLALHVGTLPSAEADLKSVVNVSRNGVYSQVSSDGSGSVDAIVDAILSACENSIQ